MRGSRKFSQTESSWEVATAVSSRESGYHSGSWPVSGLSQEHLQQEEEKAGVPLAWPDGPQTPGQLWSDQLQLQLFTGQEEEEEEETGDTKLDLLDSLILEDVKERLQQQAVSGSSLSLAKLQWRGMERSSEACLDTFIQNNVPLVFPGQLQSLQSVSFLHFSALLGK